MKEQKNANKSGGCVCYTAGRGWTWGWAVHWNADGIITAVGRPHPEWGDAALRRDAVWVDEDPVVGGQATPEMLAWRNPAPAG